MVGTCGLLMAVHSGLPEGKPKAGTDSVPKRSLAHAGLPSSSRAPGANSHSGRSSTRVSSMGTYAYGECPAFWTMPSHAYLAESLLVRGGALMATSPRSTVPAIVAATTPRAGTLLRALTAQMMTPQERKVPTIGADSKGLWGTTIHHSRPARTKSGAATAAALPNPARGSVPGACRVTVPAITLASWPARPPV